MAAIGMSVPGASASDLGLGSQLSQQTTQETEEEKKKRLQQMQQQRLLGVTPGASTLIGG